ncbi:MAG TPA: hypothetical protein VK595_13120 [Vicinamibacterales bacterium]|nr:hypothetical protein [Vicinamibacterales bacterium]
MKKLIPLALLLALAACGSSSPTAPSVLQLAGTWKGTISDAAVPGSGPAQMTIAQTGSALSGSWNATGPFSTNTGQFTGNVSAASVVMTVTSSVSGSCPLTLNGTVNGAQMTGTYATFNCTSAGGGSFSLTKE